MPLLIPVLLLTLVTALPAVRPAHAQVSPAELDEAVRNPVIGNYKGYAEFKMARYASARQIWEAIAATGNAEAHFNLAILFEDGLGVEVDMDRAIAHYLEAARGGNRNAQYRVGLLHAVGSKAPRDLALARKWLRAAADQGDEDASALLNVLDGPARNPREQDILEAETLQASREYAAAAEIWQRLANAGDARARTRLAWMHEAGQGVPRDLAEAARLFRRSAEEGDAEAQYALAVMLETGKGQPRDPSAARAWLERAAAGGYEPARTALEAVR
jgi:TPR repeat protein